MILTTPADIMGLERVRGAGQFLLHEQKLTVISLQPQTIDVYKEIFPLKQLTVDHIKVTRKSLGIQLLNESRIHLQ